MIENIFADLLEFTFYHRDFFYFFLNVFLHILTNTQFKHVTSTHYHISWYLVFEFTFNVTYFHRVIDIYCMHSYLMYQTQKIIFNVVGLTPQQQTSKPITSFHWNRRLAKAKNVVSYENSEKLFTITSMQSMHSFVFMILNHQ